MTHVDRQKKFLELYLGALQGAIITKVEVRVEDGQCWPVLHVLSGPHVVPSASPKDRGKTMTREMYELEISQDSEGNGPGWLFGLPRPEGY